MKILHLINDHQVIERTLGIYEEIYPGCNDVLVFCQEGVPFKRLKGRYEGKIVNYDNLKEIVSKYDFSGVTHVIAHYLSMEKIDFIKLVPNNIHVCWEIYGYDLYDQFLKYNGYKLYYKVDTNKYKKYGLLRKHFSTLFNTLLLLRGYKYTYTWQKRKQFNYISKRADSLQYCCRYDAKLIEDLSHRNIPSYEVSNYSLSEVLGDLKDAPFFEGKDILIGNSASFSNNHFYSLEYLKKIGIPEGARMIIPLAYGGTGNYPDDVERAYNLAFPDCVETYRTYMPLHEYNKTFLRLNAMILSAWRQESIGTAMMGLYLGIRVVMSEKNPLYKWLVDCGFAVFSIENLNINDLSTPLDILTKKKNRRTVVERYNEDVFANSLRLNLK